jgi:hypothetical protein
MKYYTSTTQFNCGIDLHAHQMYVCLMDRDGKKLVHSNIRNNDFEFFLKLIQPYRHDLTVCAECRKITWGGQVREKPLHLTPYDYFEQEQAKQKAKSTASQC